VKRTAASVALAGLALAAYLGATAGAAVPAAAPEQAGAAEPASSQATTTAAKLAYVAPTGANTNPCTEALPCRAVVVLPQEINPTVYNVKKMWVSPAGDNANPCTREAPCAQVQIVRAGPAPTTPPTTQTTTQPTTTQPPTSTSQPPPTSTSPPAVSPGCGRPTTPGQTTNTIVVNGTTRTYLKIVPDGLDPRAPVPVVMGLHGGNGTAERASASMGLTSTAPALYIYPQAGPFGGGVAWNVDPAGADFPYFEALVADLRSKHCVDPGRVFAAGVSNGGFMVNSLLCNRPNLFKAAASVAGGGPPNNCTQPRAFLAVHGTADQTVPITKGRYSRDYWLAANRYGGAAPTPITPSPCVSYPGTLNPVVWCQHTGAHTWPSWAGAGIRDWFFSLR
jgi:polyhydroxybutyrate depolymerase